MCNLEDHFIVVYNFDNTVIRNAMENLNFVLTLLEKCTGKFAYDQDAGYITVNKEHTGSGLEICFGIKTM